MSILQNKIDFVVLVSVDRANSNGDPLNGNRPRTDYEGYGEISDVCIKRKIRNRMQDLGQKIFVQSEDRRDPDDQYESLRKRAEGVLGKPGKTKSLEERERYARKACQTWLDVRSFGQVLAFGSENDEKGVSIGIRGPVSIHQAVSCSPVDVLSYQITKSVSGDLKENKARASDTMGMKHIVRFGLYLVKGSINVQLAEKTGFTQEDADIVKECLRTLFVNDASSARPEGSMEVVRLYWWQHNCKDGQCSSAKVHRSVKVALKPGVEVPRCVEDYQIVREDLAGLEPEVIDGV